MSKKKSPTAVVNVGGPHQSCLPRHFRPTRQRFSARTRTDRLSCRCRVRTEPKVARFAARQPTSTGERQPTGDWATPTRWTRATIHQAIRFIEAAQPHCSFIIISQSSTVIIAHSRRAFTNNLQPWTTRARHTRGSEHSKSQLRLYGGYRS